MIKLKASRMIIFMTILVEDMYKNRSSQVQSFAIKKRERRNPTIF
jgi:hypothetical protein